VKPQLEAISNFLDFGQVELGNENTIQDTALIKNISGFPVIIDNVVQLGPDKTQFEIVSGGSSFTLQPNESHKLTIKFKPIFGGRTSALIGFEFNGIGSPAFTQLYGVGIGGLIYISDDSAYSGEKRNLKLLMTKVKPEGIASIAPNFEALVRFQKTILAPIDNSNFNIINNSVYLKINGTIGSSEELSQIHVIAGLGNVEETYLDVIDFGLVDNSGKKVDYDFDTQSGRFKLLGICKEGGTRLINSDTKAVMLNISPNPTDGIINIEFSLTEKGLTQISIYNVMGEKVKTLFSEDVNEYNTIKIESSINDLGSGEYFYYF
jgi:hypothetical protein